MTTCEIIAVGNELLQGDVLDTNTHYLIGRITGIGGRVERAVIVRDEPDAIVRELRAAHERGTGLILTSGGLGPTRDDLTLDAVAAATGCPLLLHLQALEMVRRTYEDLAAGGVFPDAAMTPAREKMARLPRGAAALGNAAGAAPGVLMAWGGSTLVALPGVPGELKAICGTSLLPTLQRLFGRATFLERRVTVDCGDESVLAPVLERVVDRHPAVYVKSRARRLGVDMTFDITLSLSGRSTAAITGPLSAAVDDLVRALGAAGLRVLAVDGAAARGDAV
jgi:molybdenum cofactor synthesis domain-containing protein